MGRRGNKRQTEPDVERPAQSPGETRRRGRPRSGDAPDPRVVERAALKAFAASGYDGATLKDIARMAGVDPALISRRYGSKMGLWRATVDDLAGHLEQVHAEMQCAMRQDEQFPGRVIDALQRFVTFNWALPELARFFVDEVSQPGERRDYVVARIWRPYFNTVRPILETLGGGGGRNREQGGRATGFMALSLLGLVVMPQLTQGLLEGEMGVSYDDAPDVVLDGLIRFLGIAR